jgi:hypothetical protein
MTNRNTGTERSWMGVVLALLNLLALGACTDSKWSRLRAIADIEAAVNAAGTEPANTCPTWSATSTAR